MITIYNKETRNRLMVKEDDFPTYEKEGWKISKNSNTKIVNCFECGKEYELRLSKSKFCSRSCSIKNYRKKQKEDIKKEQKFRKKLSEAISKDWKENNYDDRKNKIRNTILEQVSKMTKEERIEKYGHLNKIKDEKVKNDLICKMIKNYGKNFNNNKKDIKLEPYVIKNLNIFFNIE